MSCSVCKLLYEYHICIYLNRGPQGRLDYPTEQSSINKDITIIIIIILPKDANRMANSLYPEPTSPSTSKHLGLQCSDLSVCPTTEDHYATLVQPRQGRGTQCIYYWHKVKHILKCWYKFSHTLNRANLFFLLQNKRLF